MNRKIEMERGGRVPHFLFAMWMAGGNVVFYEYLKSRISLRPEILSSFHPVEMFPTDLIARIPPISKIGALKNSAVARKRFLALEKKAGVPFDAAYFFQHTYITSLVGFRRRVPYILAMDGVPLWYAKHKLWYTHPYFDPDSLTSKIKHRITRSVYAQAYHLLPVSSGVRESLIEDYGIPEERVSVLPHSVDAVLWKFPERVAEVQARQAKRLNVLFIGADYERKGGDLLTAVARRPEFRDVDFHLVTKDFPGEPGKNIFIHTNLPPVSKALMDLYRAADLFVVPTRQDTALISALEAMAMGLPVISTPVGGITDIIVEGSTGYFVPTDDTDTLADRIRKLCSSRELRLAMGLKGRQRAESVFNVDIHVEVILNLLHRAAKRLPHVAQVPILPTA